MRSVGTVHKQGHPEFACHSRYRFDIADNAEIIWRSDIYRLCLGRFFECAAHTFCGYAPGEQLARARIRQDPHGFDAEQGHCVDRAAVDNAPADDFSAVRCGGIGAGNTTKLANQIIVAANIQAVAEALTLAQKAGVDPDLVFQAIKGGLAGSTVMNAKAPMMIEGNDKPGFKIDLHIKDLNNALDCAHTVGAPVPMTAEVQEILQWLHSNGKGQADHSAIAQYYEHLTGIKLGRDL